MLEHEYFIVYAFRLCEKHMHIVRLLDMGHEVSLIDGSEEAKQH